MPVSLPTPAPYDTLATVTSQARTILADYIAGLIPNPQGTCNVVGATVTWVSGPQFSIYFRGAVFTINDINFAVFQVQSPTKLILTTPAATQNAVPWMATIQTGEIFNDSQAYVLPTVNLAWRKLQKKLAKRGHPRLEREAILLNLPIMTNLDPAAQQYVNWSGTYDGTTFETAASGAPALPQDFISPLWVKERPHVTGTNLNRFCPMRPVPDGLRSWQKGSFNRRWDWRNDELHLPGAIQLLDLQIRFATYLADLAVANGATFGTTPVPIMRCAEALAYYSAALFVEPRGGVLAVSFDQKGDMATDQITDADAKLKQRTSYSRRAWGQRGRRGRGAGLGRW